MSTTESYVCIKPQCQPGKCIGCNSAISPTDEAARLVLDLLNDLAVDGLGAPFEDGDHSVVDRARSWLQNRTSHSQCLHQIAEPAPAAVAVPDEREAFERAYAAHAIEYVGIDAPQHDVQQRLKDGRDGDRYKHVHDSGAWVGWKLARAALAAAPAAAPPASQRDELLQVALDFIGTLTGMSPPPIEVAPPEVFAPFYAFVERVQAITAPQAPAADALDAARWREALRHIGADNQLGGAQYVIRSIAAPANVMRGSVAEYFTRSIDAAIAAQAAAQGGEA